MIKLKFRNISFLDQNSYLKKSFILLSTEDQKRLLGLSFIQIIIGLLDFIGVTLIGALGALSIQGIESRSPGNKVSHFLHFLGLEHSSFQNQISVLGLSAAFTLIAKTTLSAFFSRRIFYFLSSKGAEIAKELIAKYFAQDVLFIQSYGTQEFIFLSSEGVRNILVGILATSISILSDYFMLIVLFVGIIILDPLMAIACFIIFSGLTAILYFNLHSKVKKIGLDEYRMTVSNNEAIEEAINLYRILIVRNLREFYIDKIGKIKKNLGNLNAEMSFQPYFSKYVVEIAIVLGALLLSAFEFATKNAVHAIATIVVFMAASMRIAPALLRIQQGLLIIKNASGTSDATFQIIDKLKNRPNLVPILVANTSNVPFVPEIILNNVNFKYLTGSSFQIEGLNLVIEKGSKVAIVGKSGSGKSTIIDLILGAITPSSGSVHLSGLPPIQCFTKWPGMVGYVPQDNQVISGSISRNVVLGAENYKNDDMKLWNALKIAQLESLVSNLPESFDSDVGEKGSKLSGGQKQRLGIARALYTTPKLVVLDEATSSLDSLTEYEFSKSLSKIDKSSTVLVVAHRLATIKTFTRIIYVEDGKIIADGTFEHVRNKIPNFDKLAELNGL